jgi:hypothetical protein
MCDVYPVAVGDQKHLHTVPEDLERNNEQEEIHIIPDK